MQLSRQGSSTLLYSSLTLALMAAFQWFLTAFSVLPSNFLVIRAKKREGGAEGRQQQAAQGEP